MKIQKKTGAPPPVFFNQTTMRLLNYHVPLYESAFRDMHLESRNLAIFSSRFRCEIMHMALRIFAFSLYQTTFRPPRSRKPGFSKPMASS